MRHALLAVVLLAGCGGSLSVQDQAHQVMNRVTDVADPTYGLAVTACDAREGLILAKPADCPPGPSECRMASVAAKKHGIESTRAICDKIFAGFEALREAQLGARAAADSAADGQEDWSAALDAAKTAAEAWAELRATLMGTPWLRGEDDELAE